MGFSLKSSNVFSKLKCLFKVVREEKDINLSAHCITVIRKVVKADIINSATLNKQLHAGLAALALKP